MADLIFLGYGHAALALIPIAVTLIVCLIGRKPKRWWLRVLIAFLISTPLNWLAFIAITGPAGWIIFMTGGITAYLNIALCALTGLAVWLMDRSLARL